LQPSPAEAVKSNYYAVVDADNCNGCEICLDRCQVEAITVDEDGLAHIDLNRCIGCGLCVTTCATEALELVQKNEEEFYTPPKTGMRTYIEINKARQAKGEIAKEGS
jgi:Na+-translocating ferredoxin:NAD+ oxidoreductase RNF subunit RnfB